MARSKFRRIASVPLSLLDVFVFHCALDRIDSSHLTLRFGLTPRRNASPVRVHDTAERSMMCLKITSSLDHLSLS